MQSKLNCKLYLTPPSVEDEAMMKLFEILHSNDFSRYLFPRDDVTCHVIFEHNLSVTGFLSQSRFLRSDRPQQSLHQQTTGF